MLGQIIYFHHRYGRKIYFQVYGRQTIYFEQQQISKKRRGQKNYKYEQIKRLVGEYVVGRIGVALFFCSLLARNIVNLSNEFRASEYFGIDFFIDVYNDI